MVFLTLMVTFTANVPFDTNVVFDFDANVALSICHNSLSVLSLFCPFVLGR
jgi:hypothetical protein